jgi:hypothetical protein
LAAFDIDGIDEQWAGGLGEASEAEDCGEECSEGEGCLEGKETEAAFGGGEHLRGVYTLRR